jgi:hypothetical protein
MAEELIQTLKQLRHDIALDTERIVEEKIAPLRDIVLTNFDTVYKRFDDLAIEYQALKGGMIRLEHRMDRLEKPHHL